jgi:hypothetical protein
MADSSLTAAVMSHPRWLLYSMMIQMMSTVATRKRIVATTEKMRS